MHLSACDCVDLRKGTQSSSFENLSICSFHSSDFILGSNSIQTVTSFKILNDVLNCTLLDL